LGQNFGSKGTKVPRIQRLLAEANQTSEPRPAALKPRPVEIPTLATPAEVGNAQEAVRAFGQKGDGAGDFSLPRGGGEFDMTTEGELVAQSPFTADITVPYSGQGQLASYDGQKKITVHYEGYGVFDVEAPITVGSNQCETTNLELNQAGW